MQIIRGLLNLKSHEPCVATIGNFDGVHLGHQALLKQLIQQAKKLNLPSVVVLFEPQPNEYFSRDKIPPRLMRLREKITALSACGIDKVVILPFNSFIEKLSPEEFVAIILHKGLGINYLVIGDDFRFGHLRRGDFSLLQNLGLKFNFAVEKMPTFNADDDRVSSSRIRKLLEQGDLQSAKKLLGCPFTLSGRVAHGNKRGRIIGFPTANIYLHRKAVPIAGVYAVKTHGLEENPVLGVANVGNRPTVDGTRSLLEVHLFDFDKMIYGQHVTVEFVKKLRDEKKFESFELLRDQILKDAEEGRKFFDLK